MGDAPHEHEEHIARFHELHDKTSGEAADGEGPLRAGQEACGIGGTRGAGGCHARFGHVVDEGAGDGDLSSRVAELGKSGVEEAVLFVEGFDVCAGVGFFGLEGHVGVCC